MSKNRAIKLEEGKTYKIKTRSSFSPVKIHVDKVIPNPYYSPRVKDIKNAEDLIVFRVWLRSKQSFKWFVEPYWVLCIYNDWSYKLKDNE